MTKASRQAIAGINSGNRVESVDVLDIVLKSVEVCNIACTYCYYYFSGDDSWKTRPKYLPISTAQDIANWIGAAVRDLDVKSVSITFHGGEPLLMKPHLFSELCGLFQDMANENGVHQSFAIQTNGMLVSSEWIDLFAEFDVSVGVSIDGPKQYHDLYRVDKQGKGTLLRVEAGLVKLVEAADAGRIKPPGLLAVINPDFDYSAVYNYFRGLGIVWMDFLLPAISYEDENYQSTLDGVYKAQRDVFRSWVSEDNPEVYVRFIDSLLSFFGNNVTRHKVETPEFASSVGVAVISVGSNGDLGVREEIFATGWPQKFEVRSIYSVEARDLLNSAPFKDVLIAADLIPDKCFDCEFVGWCRGGELKNRYSSDNLFNNRSIFCQGLKELYTEIVGYLSTNGYPADAIRKKLSSANSQAQGRV